MDSLKAKISERIPDRSSLPSPTDKLKSLVGRGSNSGSGPSVNARPISSLPDPNRFGPPPKRTHSTDAETIARTDTGGAEGSSTPPPAISSKAAPPLPGSKPKPSIPDRTNSAPGLPPRLPPRSGSISTPSPPAAFPAPNEPLQPDPNRRTVLSTAPEYTPAAPKALPSNIQVGPAKLPSLPPINLKKNKGSSFTSMFGDKKPQTVAVKTDTGKIVTFESYADDEQMKRIAERGIGASGIGINKDSPETSGWGAGKAVQVLAGADGGRKPVPPPPSRTAAPQSKPLSFEEAKAQVLAPLQGSSRWQEVKDVRGHYDSAKSFEAAHGDQLRQGLATANRLQEKHGDKVTKALGEEQAGQIKAGLGSATATADLSKAVIGKKKPPPPPPKKKDLTVGQGPPGPPPVNFGSRPNV